MSAYYNEHDPFAAAWLKELIKAGLIADGEVDERDIQTVQATDLAGFTQCHFFAGIGGWSYALRLAGWDDARPVWTGSCPCQGYSAAGRQEGAADTRNLWPTWFRLIQERHPHPIFGEQVANATGHGWLDDVSTKLEAEAYAIGAVVLGAHSVGAPHIRQRLWFVAESQRPERRPLTEHQRDDRHEIEVGPEGSGWLGERGESGALDNAERERAERIARSEGCAERETSCDGEYEGRRQLQTLNAGSDDSELGQSERERQRTGRIDSPTARHDSAIGREDRTSTAEPSDVSELGLTEGAGPQGERRESSAAVGHERGRFAGLPSDAWACDWIPCIDGRSRPVEPGTFPLAHGVSGRVGRLRGYGNAIVPQVAAAFIGAYLESAV